jgi:hypothetical protein
VRGTTTDVSTGSLSTGTPSTWTETFGNN